MCDEGENEALAAIGFTACGTAETISVVLGLVALVLWVIGELPQVIKNFQRRSVEGLSGTLCRLWLYGDIAGLVAAFAAKLLPTQMITAIWFVAVDGALNIEYCMFVKRPPKGSKVLGVDTSPPPSTPVVQPPVAPAVNEKQPTLLPTKASLSPREPESELLRDLAVHKNRDDDGDHHHNANPRMSSDIINSSTKPAPNQPRTVIPMAILASFVFAGSMTFAPSPLQSTGRQLLSYPETPMETLGWSLGWFTATCYIWARISQLRLTFSKKSADAVSVQTFVMLLAANLCYVLSLLVRSQELAYIWKNLPWIVGPSTNVLLDLGILWQSHHYRVKKTRPSIIELKPIQSQHISVDAGVVEYMQK